MTLTPTAEIGRRTPWRAVVVVITLGLCATSLYLCYRAIRVMERAVTVVEHIDAKLDRAIAAAPGTVDKGKQLLETNEAALRDAAKSKAATAEEKAKEWLRQKANP